MSQRFEVGDKLRVKFYGGIDLSWHREGSIVTVSQVDYNGCIRELEENKSGSRFCYGHRWYELVERSHKTVNKEQQSMNNYEFKTSSPSAIDFEEIAKECTKHNPLILIETTIDEKTLPKLQQEFKDLGKKAMAIPVEDKEKVDKINAQLVKLEKKIIKAKAHIELAKEIYQPVLVMIHDSVLDKANLIDLESDNLNVDSFHAVTRSTEVHVVERKEITTIKAWAKKVINAEWPDAVETVVKVKGLL